MSLADMRDPEQAKIGEPTPSVLESDSRFHALARYGFDVVFETDGDGQILYVSPNSAEGLGVSAQELQGESFYKWVHPDDREDVRSLLRQLPDTTQPVRMVLRFWRPDGSWRWLEAHVKTFPVGRGEPRRMLVARDISDRKRAEVQKLKLEDQLRHAQKMEAIGRLAGGIAHDFNNLLTAIVGGTALLLESLPEEDPLRTEIDEVHRAGQRASTLTRQLLAFSRRQLLQPRVVDLDSVVRDLERMLQRVIGEDIRLATRLSGDIGSIRADRGQIEQVILNLAVNGRDAMPRGGVLTIETANAELDADYARDHIGVDAGSYVMLAVTDGGCGMDEEVKRRIFDPFFTTKGRGKGTGLGLATVYGIVQQSGGSIWVYSEVGHGTTFKVYLPRIEARARPDAARLVDDSSDTVSRTVLVVEDDPGVRRLACRVLSSRGYQVLEARDAAEARGLHGEHLGSIDLVLTDVVMPGVSGPEMVEALRVGDPELRALFMSGYAEGSVFEQGVIEGGAPFLAKPFTPQSLVAAVRDAIKG